MENLSKGKKSRYNFTVKLLGKQPKYGTREEQKRGKRQWHLAWGGAHNRNPSTLGGQGGWITSGQEFETSLTNMEKPCLY